MTDNEKQPLLSSKRRLSPPTPRVSAKSSRRCCPSPFTSFQVKAARKKLKDYYDDQNELQNLFDQDAAMLAGKPVEDDEDDKKAKMDYIVSRIVFAANVVLLFGKAFAALLTEGVSLAIISTLLDSVFDITSGFVIGLASWAILNTDAWTYPRGRKDLELLAIMTVGLFMGGFNLFIIVQSVFKIVNNDLGVEVTAGALLILAGTVVTKACLFVLCWKIGTPSLKVLAIDQRNDVLTNIVAGAGAGLASSWTPYADPVAASLISGYIVWSWVGVVLEQIPLLVGVACTRQEYARVQRIILDHHDSIRYIDTLLVYHTGAKCRVEAHVVLDPETPCHIVHDVIEDPLKRKLERLSFVDRAFIHPDYELDFFD